jgi:hypothetical protein
MGGIALFTSQQREHIRDDLVIAAKADERIGGAAHLGSAAIGLADRWSDIDLGLGLVPDADLDQVLLDWTRRLYENHGAVAHYDVRHGDILYRVFLLVNTLQVDLSFWPFDQLRAIGPKFSLIFGAAGEPIPTPVPDSSDLIGMAWLYALHVRSSLARFRLLQTDHMLNGMRDNVFSLICKRHNVTPTQGRGLDDLPEEVRVGAAACLACSLDPAELTRAFLVTMEVLLDELRRTEPRLNTKLQSSLRLLANSIAFV